MTMYIQGGKISISSMIQKSPTQARMNEIHAQILNPKLIDFSLQKTIKSHHLYWQHNKQ
jgi:hypothetical protein